MKVAAREGAERGIAVNAVCPGLCLRHLTRR
jgi:NAD(P)-dependent dehydrogenase (short-subunit alcohol dehydrogenase family)